MVRGSHPASFPSRLHPFRGESQTLSCKKIQGRGSSLPQLGSAGRTQPAIWLLPQVALKQIRQESLKSGSDPGSLVWRGRSYWPQEAFLISASCDPRNITNLCWGLKISPSERWLLFRDLSYCKDPDFGKAWSKSDSYCRFLFSIYVHPQEAQELVNLSEMF